MEDNDIRKRLEEADWKTMHPSLLKFARKYLQGDRNGRTPEDVVQEAIEKVYSGALGGPRRRGARVWDGKVSLFTFLCGVIRSQGSNLLRHHDYQRVRYPGQLELEKSAGSVRLDPADSFAKEEFFDELEQCIQSRDDLKGLWELLLRGYRKPANIAEELGVSVEQVYRQKRQLKNLVHRIRELINRPSLPEKKPMRSLWKTSLSQSENPLSPPEAPPSS